MKKIKGANCGKNKSDPVYLQVIRPSNSFGKNLNAQDSKNVLHSLKISDTSKSSGSELKKRKDKWPRYRNINSCEEMRRSKTTIEGCGCFKALPEYNRACRSRGDRSRTVVLLLVKALHFARLIVVVAAVIVVVVGIIVSIRQQT